MGVPCGSSSTSVAAIGAFVLDLGLPVILTPRFHPRPVEWLTRYACVNCGVCLVLDKFTISFRLLDHVETSSFLWTPYLQHEPNEDEAT